MSIQGKIESFISVVLIVKNPNTNVKEKITELSTYLVDNYEDHEIVIISNSSDSDSVESISNLLTVTPHIRYLEMITAVPDDVAIASGIENAIGDFVLFFDPLRDPIDLIRESTEISLAGKDIVLGSSKLPQSVFYSTFKTIFHKTLSGVLNYKIPPDFTGFMLLSRRTVNTITRTSKFNHKFLMKICNSGYGITSLNYNIIKSTYLKKQTKTLMGGFKFTIQMIVFNSLTPLRFMNFLGLLGGFLSFLIAAYAIVVNLLKNEIVEGWTTQMLFSSALFFLLFVILAFFGEYLARLINETSDNQEYDVLFEKNSSVMVNEDRVNVLHESESNYKNNVQTGRNR